MLLALELPGKELTVTGFGAVLGFLATITVEQFKRRREPQKRLAWTATTRSADVALDDEMRNRLHISFDGRQVEDLTSVEFSLHNAGNTRVRDHQLRFEFPDSCNVLAADVCPIPEREMAARRCVDLEVSDREAIFRIGHIERGRTVSFRLVASGPDSARWKTISHNDAGDVEYREGARDRTVSDADHVPQFLALLLLLLALPPVLGTAATLVDYDLSELVSMAIYSCCLLAMFPHVLPTCRAVRDALVAHRLGQENTSPRFEINGTDNAVVFGDRLRTVTLNPPMPRASEPSGPVPDDGQPDDAHAGASGDAGPAH